MEQLRCAIWLKLSKDAKTPITVKCYRRQSTALWIDMNPPSLASPFFHLSASPRDSKLSRNWKLLFSFSRWCCKLLFRLLFSVRVKSVTSASSLLTPWRNWKSSTELPEICWGNTFSPSPPPPPTQPIWIFLRFERGKKARSEIVKRIFFGETICSLPKLKLLQFHHEHTGFSWLWLWASAFHRLECSFAPPKKKGRAKELSKPFSCFFRADAVLLSSRRAIKSWEI